MFITVAEMGMYDLVIGVVIILMIGIVWTLLGHNLNTTADTMSQIIPTTINNESVDVADIINEIDFSQKVYYVWYFIITVLVFMWVIKKSSRDQNV